MEGKKRVTIYLEKEDYKKLRAKLILAGQTVSGWVREHIKKFLQE